MRDIEGVVERIGGQGDGIVNLEQGRYYVPFTVPGDRVQARAGRERGDGHAARMNELLTAGPDRIDPVCTLFHQCGGCQLQHWAAEPYLAWKREMVVKALERRDLDPAVVQPIVAAGLHARRRADLVARRIGKGVLLGLFERDSKRIVDMTECAVLAPQLVALLPHLRDLLTRLLAPAAGCDVLLLLTEGGVDVALGGLGRLDAAQRQMLAAFANDHDLARLSLPNEVVTRRKPATLRFGKVAVELPPGGFAQADAAAEAVLVREALAGLAGATKIADLFAGAGTFTFPLAAQGNVRAFDGDRALGAALQDAADRAVMGGRVRAEVRDLFRRPLGAAELNAFDGAIFDPPRAGAREQAEQLAASRVPAVVGISCNPTTFARDARLLVDGGYTLTRVVPVDQFRFTTHVELAGLFTRGR